MDKKELELANAGAKLYGAMMYTLVRYDIFPYNEKPVFDAMSEFSKALYNDDSIWLSEYVTFKQKVTEATS